MKIKKFDEYFNEGIFRGKDDDIAARVLSIITKNNNIEIEDHGIFLKTNITIDGEVIQIIIGKEMCVPSPLPTSKEDLKTGIYYKFIVDDAELECSYIKKAKIYTTLKNILKEKNRKNKEIEKGDIENKKDDIRWVLRPENNSNTNEGFTFFTIPAVILQLLKLVKTYKFSKNINQGNISKLCEFLEKSYKSSKKVVVHDNEEKISLTIIGAANVSIMELDKLTNTLTFFKKEVVGIIPLIKKGDIVLDDNQKDELIRTIKKLERANSMKKK